MRAQVADLESKLHDIEDQNSLMEVNIEVHAHDCAVLCAVCCVVCTRACASLHVCVCAC